MKKKKSYKRSGAHREGLHFNAALSGSLISSAVRALSLPSLLVAHLRAKKKS